MIFWVSRHDLSPAQMLAIRDIHGDDVAVVWDTVAFYNTAGLAEYIRSQDGFVYAVAAAPHYIVAALEGLRFGLFENHPAKRQDGTFGLAAVYHVERGSFKKVWVNTDPTSDKGEVLIPAAR